jgi:hypothetical protein
MSDNDPDFDYRRTLTPEILAMRDTVQGWQHAGQPHGLPVDLAADCALGDAVRHLTAAAAALDPAIGITDPARGGGHPAHRVAECGILLRLRRHLRGEECRSGR